MEHSHTDIRQHVKKYIVIFVALLVLTVLTVAVSYFHLPVATAVIVAMIIASIKGSLVAAYFMHLKSEKKAIYLTLLFTGIFVLGLIVITIASFSDQVRV